MAGLSRPLGRGRSGDEEEEDALSRLRELLGLVRTGAGFSFGFIDSLRRMKSITVDLSLAFCAGLPAGLPEVRWEREPLGRGRSCRLSVSTDRLVTVSDREPSESARQMGARGAGELESSDGGRALNGDTLREDRVRSFSRDRRLASDGEPDGAPPFGPRRSSMSTLAARCDRDGRSGLEVCRGGLGRV